MAYILKFSMTLNEDHSLKHAFMDFFRCPETGSFVVLRNSLINVNFTNYKEKVVRHFSELVIRITKETLKSISLLS